MSYDASSVQHLSFRDGCRLRVGIYLGSADNEGVLNGLLEIVNNSTDEANIGYGKKIEIEVSKRWASVKDYGRGLPRGKTDKSEEVMITLLTENHSGAKFNKKAYAGFSRGLNGSGGGATAVTSDWFKVVSKRDGYEWSLELENGIPTTKTAVQGKATKETGTYMKWQPSQEVFSTEEINIDYNKVCEIIEEYSYFNIGVTFVVKNADTGEEKIFLSKNGLKDFAKNKIKNGINSPILYNDKDAETGAEIEIIAQWTTNRHERYYLFANGAECPEGGTPITGAKTGITRTINNLTKSSFSGDLIRKGLIYIISIKHPNPIFANQIKSKITNPELRGLADRAFSTAITDFANKKMSEFNSIMNMLTKTDKAERAAERARDAVLNTNKELNKNRKMKTFASDKLKDAVVLGQDSTLILVEGDSAANPFKVARSEFVTETPYGILALRGKIISALTNPIEDVLENEEVRLIISALGLTLNKYNSKDLRYGKIAIATDADADGYGITNLIIALFYVLFPEILREGRLYKFHTPLYKVTQGKKEYYYYTEEERANGIKGTSQERYKGLGSLDLKDVTTIFFGEWQRLEQLVWDDEAEETIKSLLGKDVQPRKDFVFSNIDFREYGGLV